METLDLTHLIIKKRKQDQELKEKLIKHEYKKKVKVRMKDLIVKVLKVRDTSKIPEYKHPGDGACDLCADFPEDHWTLTPMSTILIPTGIKIEMPKGYCALVLPRSGLSLKTPLRIANSPGLIDNEFVGEIQLIVDNIGSGVATINRGDRLAHLMFIKTEQARFQEVQSLSETDRGENGFGSTGVKS